MEQPRRLPLIAPRPPRLSELGNALRRVEASGIFSNNGPEVRAFEAEASAQLFADRGPCLAVANATLGLMVAIRDAAGAGAPGRHAIMPALTFAATAEAAYWAGLTPLVIDIDPDDWAASAAAEERLLRDHAARIGCLVPYATFAHAIDLERYAWLQRRYGVGVVIDAAASLGTIDAAGHGFGAGAPFAIVYSMHATKTFAVGEGGLIHAGDAALIERLRSMINFGFDGSRSAARAGLNAKLPEVMAVLARARLTDFAAICDHRAALEAAYREALGGVTLQQAAGQRRAMQFMPVLLPDALAPQRDRIAAALGAQGIGTGRYFSPHLGEQPWVRSVALVEPTPVADRVAGGILSLPITDDMTAADARRVAAALVDACAAARPRRAAAAAEPAVAELLIVGGGPAGTALLTAAAKDGRLPALSRGLVVVERDHGIGGGRLGHYAITSDSTAETFLTAIENNAQAELAALATHPAADTVARFKGKLGVPLADVGPLLRVTGDRLADVIRGNGGEILSGHEATGATRDKDGLWRVTLATADGRTIERRARHLVIATGGHQPLDRLAAQSVAGAPLVTLAGDRLVQSDEVLALGGFERVADLLASKRDPRIAVIGGSTSALTTVALLLKRTPALPLGANGITLLHRRPLRPFYPSADAARADCFTDFGPDDICPVSGFVYRLAGFRLEARELVLRLLRVNGRRPDPRVRALRIGDDEERARRVLQRADLVVAALGYRPRALPLSDAAGAPLALAAYGGKPMVDRHCRVLGADGQPLPNLYGIGLAAGFVPWGKLGGEASFSGQANGLWLWQNDVGRMIVDQVLAASDALAHAA